MVPARYGQRSRKLKNDGRARLCRCLQSGILLHFLALIYIQDVELLFITDVLKTMQSSNVYHSHVHADAVMNYLDACG